MSIEGSDLHETGGTPRRPDDQSSIESAEKPISLVPRVALDDLLELIKKKDDGPGVSIPIALRLKIIGAESSEAERTAVVRKLQSILTGQQDISDNVRANVEHLIEKLEGAVAEKDLDPVLARREHKLNELSAKREAMELSPLAFDLNYICQLNEAGVPLRRKDMLHETGGQALVLARKDFEVLGFLEFIHVSGERMVIEAESLDPKDVFILYPHEVGDEEAGSPASSRRLIGLLFRNIRAILSTLVSYINGRI